MLINKFFPSSVFDLFKRAMTRDGNSKQVQLTTISTDPSKYFRLYVLKDTSGNTRITDKITGSDVHQSTSMIYFVDIPKNFASINLKLTFMGVRIGYAENQFDMTHIDVDRVYRVYRAYRLEPYPVTGYLKHPIHQCLLDFYIGMMCGLLLSLPEYDDE